MIKKRKHKKRKNHHKNHPIYKQEELTLGQKAADVLTRFAGSWTFIILLFIFLFIWMSINVFFFIGYNLGKPFDPYPFILLNLILSCLATVQAPIILMSQNRADQKARVRAEYDYQVNRKAEREIKDIQKDMNDVKGHLFDIKKQVKRRRVAKKSKI